MPVVTSCVGSRAVTRPFDGGEVSLHVPGKYSVFRETLKKKTVPLLEIVIYTSLFFFFRKHFVKKSYSHTLNTHTWMSFLRVVLHPK